MNNTTRNIIGPAIIGFLTAVMGFPVFVAGTINVLNLLILFGCIILWNIIFDKLERK